MAIRRKERRNEEAAKDMNPDSPIGKERRVTNQRKS
jgi:hypothetical protein